jgi:hypothetical protein
VRIRAARIRSAIALSIHVPQRRGVDAAGGPTPIGFPRRVLCLARLESRAMFSKPLAYPSTLDRRPRCFCGPVLRGGALEPEPRAGRRNVQAKADAYRLAQLQRAYAEGLSLSGGASIRSSPSSS